MDILAKAAGKAINKAIVGKVIGDVAGKAIGAAVAGKVIGNAAGKAINRAFEERGNNVEANFTAEKRTTRKDLKLAQLQIEKAKIDEEARKQELARAMIAREADMRSMVASQVTDILDYTKNNMDYIFSAVRSLRDDCLFMKDRMEQFQLQMLSRASFIEKRRIKRDMKETKKSADYKLGCLYLSKEYLSLLSMFANGLVLTDVQSAFIVKFAPFFSGVKVFDIEDEDADIEEDDEMTRTISGIKVDAESSLNLDLSEYLTVHFEEQLEKYVLPEIETLFQLFTNAANNKGRGNPLNRSAAQYCEYCGCVLEKNYGTCAHCGAPI